MHKVNSFLKDDFKIYAFWIGDKSKISALTNKLESMGFNYEIGPSSNDHDFLMKNVMYYKEAFDQKIYSFCSDVWRFWKLSISKGMYIGATAELGVDFPKFVEETRSLKQKSVMFKEASNLLLSGYLVSNVENNDLFSEVYQSFKLINRKEIRYLFVAPELLTAIVKKRFNFQHNFEKDSNNEIFLYTIKEIRNKTTIYNISKASWVMGKENGKGLSVYDRVEKRWDDKIVIKAKEKAVKKVMKYGFNSINPWFIRDAYEFYPEKRKEISKYWAKNRKEIKATFSEKLIWSKIAVFFKMLNK